MYLRKWRRKGGARDALAAEPAELAVGMLELLQMRSQTRLAAQHQKSSENSPALSLLGANDLNVYSQMCPACRTSPKWLGWEWL